MRLQLNSSSLYFLFLSIRRLGWRCYVLFGRAVYLLGEQEWVESPLWAAWDRERVWREVIHPIFSAVFDWSIHFAVPSQALSSVPTDRVLLSPGSPGRRARANPRTCSRLPREVSPALLLAPSIFQQQFFIWLILGLPCMKEMGPRGEGDFAIILD